jgi:CRISPR system Cascade subunit CasD
MNFLVFQLHAPLSSWGEPAVGEFRGTADHPSQSALIGLLGAALGLLRDDETGHAALRDSHGFAVGLLSGGSLLRDFHTAQVPPRSAMKGRPSFTRRAELSIPKSELGTMLSTRDYRQNAASLVAIVRRQEENSLCSLKELAQALRTPKFTLYLGRKACAPASPLWPQVLEGDSAKTVFEHYSRLHEDARLQARDRRGRLPLEPLPVVGRIYFDNHIVAGVPALVSVPRKDRIIRRTGWQFGDRTEHMAVLAEEA